MGSKVAYQCCSRGEPEDLPSLQVLGVMVGPLPPLTTSSPAVQKRLALAEKYKQLKRTGKLEKFLSKKRKKNTQRDRRQLPFKRKQ